MVYAGQVFMGPGMCRVVKEAVRQDKGGQTVSHVPRYPTPPSGWGIEILV